MTDDERAAIEELRQMHPQWRDAARARNQCAIATDALRSWVPGAQRVWIDNGSEPRHVAALLPSGAVVDLTAAQFGTPDEYDDLEAVLKTWIRYRISEAHWGGSGDWVYRDGTEPREPSSPSAKLVPPRARRGRIRR